MARLVSRVAIAAATSWLVAGCAYNDHFDNRVARYDIASEQARDQMIFTNIVRASRAEPLAFLQLGQINGSNTSVATMGIPSLILGPGLRQSCDLARSPAGSGTAFLASALDKQAVFGANPGATGFTANSLSTTGTTNFNVTPAETKDFYRGLLLTVEPETLAFFLEQGIAPELLFYLFTDKVVEEKGGAINIYSNDPFDPSFGKFQYYVALAMTYGLTAEPEPGSKPKPAKSDTSGKSDKNEQSHNLNGDNGPARSGGSVSIGPRGRRERSSPTNTRCAARTRRRRTRAVTFRDATGKRVEARVVSRSTFSIFQYLGRLVAEGSKAQVFANQACTTSTTSGGRRRGAMAGQDQAA